MRVNSAIDKKYEALVFSAIALMNTGAWYLIVAMDFSMQLAAIGFASVVMASAFLLWFLFGTYYELRGGYLYCKCGPFTEIIYYDNIISLTLSKNAAFSLAMSAKRIEIAWDDDGCVIETMISPKNRDLFLKQLKEKCRYLEDAA